MSSKIFLKGVILNIKFLIWVSFSFLIFLSLLFLTLTSCTKEYYSEETVIANIGNTSITAYDFRISYELASPGKKITASDINLKKESYLKTMVEDKLLTLEGLERKLDEDKDIQRLLNWYEKEAVIRELYKEVVSDEVNVDESEIRDAYILSNQKLYLRQFLYQSKEEANNVYHRLQNGEDFEKIAMENAQSESELEYLITPKEFLWGELDEKFETVAYGLNHMGYSPPLKSDAGYHIVQMVNRKENLIVTESVYNEKYHYIETIIRRRKEAELAKNYIKSAMIDKKLRVNGPIFAKILTNAQNVFKLEKTESPVPIHSQVRLIRPYLANLMDEELIIFEGGHWSVGEFFDRVEDMPHEMRPDMTNPGKLQVSVALMFRDEYLAHEAYNSGLQTRPAVLKDVILIRDEVVAEKMRRSIIDTIQISDEDIRDYYSQKITNYTIPEMVRVQEIMLRDIQLADSLLLAIQNGAEIKKLAKIYSVRKWAAKRGGDLGFISENSFGNIGKEAIRYKVGRIVGPVHIKIDTFTVGYSIFKVIDRKPSNVQSLSEVYNRVSDELLNSKQSEAMERFYSKAEKKYPIALNKDALESIKTSEELGTGRPIDILKLVRR
jgi:peptidyl-prolyl cis-trans isomerase C